MVCTGQKVAEVYVDLCLTIEPRDTHLIEGVILTEDESQGVLVVEGEGDDI